MLNLQLLYIQNTFYATFYKHLPPFKGPLTNYPSKLDSHFPNIPGVYIRIFNAITRSGFLFYSAFEGSSENILILSL